MGVVWYAFVFEVILSIDMVKLITPPTTDFQPS
jgi:hypothetical protein